MRLPALDILLVEDSPTDLLLTMEALTEAKLLNRINVVHDGIEAMAYLRREGKYLDAVRPGLILLDLNLPRKDGREVLEEVKNDPLLKHIPVVVMTSSKAEEDVARAYGSYASGYVTKPVDFPSFSEAMRAMGTYWFQVVTLPTQIGLDAAGTPGPVVSTPRDSTQLRLLLLEDNPVDVLLLQDARSNVGTSSLASYTPTG